MIPLRKVLQSIEKSLEDLTQKTKDMHRLLDTLEGAFTAEKTRTRKAAKKKPGRKAVAKKKPARKAMAKKKRARKAPAKKKPKKITGTAAVLTIIQRSKKGVTTAQIKKGTGLNEKQIWNIVNHAKRQGKIKSEKKGIYVKA